MVNWITKLLINWWYIIKNFILSILIDDPTKIKQQFNLWIVNSYNIIIIDSIIFFKKNILKFIVLIYNLCLEKFKQWYIIYIVYNFNIILKYWNIIENLFLIYYCRLLYLIYLFVVEFPYFLIYLLIKIREYIQSQAFIYYWSGNRHEAPFFTVPQLLIPGPLCLRFDYLNYKCTIKKLFKVILTFSTHYSIWTLFKQIIQLLLYIVKEPVAVFGDIFGIRYVFYILRRIYRMWVNDIGMYDFDVDYVPYIRRYCEGKQARLVIWETRAIRYFGKITWIEKLGLILIMYLKYINIKREEMGFVFSEIKDEANPIAYSMVRGTFNRRYHLVRHYIRSLFKIVKGFFFSMINFVFWLLQYIFLFFNNLLFYFFFYENWLLSLLIDNILLLIEVKIKFIFYWFLKFIVMIVVYVPFVIWVDWIWEPILAPYIRFRRWYIKPYIKEQREFSKKLWLQLGENIKFAGAIQIRMYIMIMVMVQWDNLWSKFQLYWKMIFLKFDFKMLIAWVKFIKNRVVKFIIDCFTKFFDIDYIFIVDSSIFDIDMELIFMEDCEIFTYDYVFNYPYLWIMNDSLNWRVGFLYRKLGWEKEFDPNKEHSEQEINNQLADANLFFFGKGLDKRCYTTLYWKSLVRNLIRSSNNYKIYMYRLLLINKMIINSQFKCRQYKDYRHWQFIYTLQRWRYQKIPSAQFLFHLQNFQNIYGILYLLRYEFKNIFKFHFHIKKKKFIKFLYYFDSVLKFENLIVARRAFYLMNKKGSINWINKVNGRIRRIILINIFNIFPVRGKGDYYVITDVRTKLAWLYLDEYYNMNLFALKLHALLPFVKKCFRLNGFLKNWLRKKNK